MGAAAIVALTLVAYIPAMSAGFIWDDDAYVTDNTLLRNVEGLGRIWVPRETPQYYPVVFTTFWIEYQLWGLYPAGYHIVNILLHVINALLVWRVCRWIGIPGGDAAAWLVGAVFALHPVHVESVAWITERKNVLSGLFYLVAMLAYLRFDGAATAGRSQHDGNARRWPWYIAALSCFVLALLSKTVTCSLPAALILIFLHQRKRLTLGRLLPLAPFFVIGACLAMLTVHLEREHVGAEGARFMFTFAERLIIASQALLFYPWKIIWPWPLVFIYPRWTIDTSSIASFWAVGAVFIAAIAAAVAFLSNWRGPALAAAFYAGTIFPALGFFNIYPMLFSFVADHFQYLASLGVIVLIVGGAAWMFGVSGWRIVAVGAVVLLVLLATTLHQTTHYRDAETLWLHTLSHNEPSWLAHNNLSKHLIARGLRLRAEGKPDAEAVLGRGYQHLCRAMELNDDLRVDVLRTDPKLCLVMGAYYDRKNRIDDAVDHYVMYLRRFPGDSRAYAMLGDTLRNAGRTDEAVGQYRNAANSARTTEDRVVAQQKLSEALLDLAQQKAGQGDLAAAESHAREAEGFARSNNLSELAERARQSAEAYRPR